MATFDKEKFCNENELPVAVFELNSAFEISVVNDLYCKLVNSTKNQLQGKCWIKTIDNDYHQVVYDALKNTIKYNKPSKITFKITNNGETSPLFICHLKAVQTKNQKVKIIGTLTETVDVAEAINAETKSKDSMNLIGIDPLTKLYTKELFAKILIKRINHAVRTKNILAVLYMTVNNSQDIIDQYGSEKFDKVIVSTAHRLRTSLRSEDSVARIGKVDFAILIEDIANEKYAIKTVERLLDVLLGPIKIGLLEIRLQVSMGLSIFPKDFDDPRIRELYDLILKIDPDADFDQHKRPRMYASHLSNQILFKKLNRHMLIVENLRSAIDNNELELVYQPQIEMQTKRLAGIEALLRWNNAALSNPGPAEFIPIAEETGYIDEIGDWVIKEALNQYAKWNTELANQGVIRLSINLSAQQIIASNFIHIVQDLLKDTVLDHNQLMFELTETAVMKCPVKKLTLLNNLLRDLHVGISIDDFGSGFSAISYLKFFTVNELKIDKSYIDNIGEPETELIIKAIISLAKTLGLKTVAEGVETSSQASFLENNQCDIIQGFYYSKPLNVEDITAYIQQYAKNYCDLPSINLHSVKNYPFDNAVITDSKGHSKEH